MPELVRLNLGCADLPIEGFINIDKSTSPHIKSDLTADILELDKHFEPESVDEICFFHGIEHMYPQDIPKTVEMWKSLLKKGGILALVTPDFKVLAESYLQGDISIDKLNDEFLYSYCQEDWHKSMHDQESLFTVLANAGFTNIKPINRLTDPRLCYHDSIQVGAEGTK